MRSKIFFIVFFYANFLKDKGGQEYKIYNKERIKILWNLQVLRHW